MPTEDSGEPIPPSPPEEVRAADPRSDGLIREFVEHWGMMARSWGINATMGELFALLYISGTEWTAEALCDRLQVSRGNVSMNLRELMAWGVVHKIHRQGERREFYRAETDVWTLFRRILSERKRRELDPTLLVLDRSVHRVQQDPDLAGLQGRLDALQSFFSLIDGLASRLMTLEIEDVDLIRQLLGIDDEASQMRPRG
ncbi:GbsR/MarR family transcriptional regulator [Singulisphaera sp. PoT]|uniref:GbsR/MarR family transcriptional regulator n=1 Tax=Singulisphaera sp. PoT TaxID=3411797 RepID=UPI003BF502BB